MKKLLSLILVVLLMFTLVACGSEGGSTNTGNSDTNSTGEGTSKKDNDDNYQSDADLPAVVRVNLSTVKYCVDAPEYTSRSNTGYIVKMGPYFVVYDQYLDPASNVEFGIDSSAVSKADEVFEKMEKQVAATCKNGLIFADDYKLNISDKESIKVNGWDMCKYTGTIKLTCEYPLDYESANFVGYSLIKDNCPVYFAVVEKPDSDEKIDIENMADKIAKTFREYSED